MSERDMRLSYPPREVYLGSWFLLSETAMKNDKPHRHPREKPITRFTRIALAALCAIAALVAPSPSRAQPQTLEYGFESGYEGWIGDFADFPTKDSVNWRLSHRIDTMPEIRPAQSGVVLKGDNFSDDLFLFLKRKLTGLLPNTDYTLAFSVDVATRESFDMIGGSDLTLKAGATVTEPRKVASAGDMFRMNLDKGNQSSTGKDMDTLGKVRHTFKDAKTHLITLNNAFRPFHAKTGSDGTAWLIIGAESAFETSNVTLNIAAIRVMLTAPNTALRSRRRTRTVSRAAPGNRPLGAPDRAWTGRLIPSSNR
jgi:hypothetical protein